VCLFAYLYFIVGVLTTNFQYFDAYLKSKFWIWKHFLINILFSNFILEVIHYQRNWFFLAWLIILLIGSNPFFNTWFPYLKFALIHNTSNDDNHSQTTEITTSLFPQKPPLTIRLRLYAPPEVSLPLQPTQQQETLLSHTSNSKKSREFSIDEEDTLGNWI